MSLAWDWGCLGQSLLQVSPQSVVQQAHVCGGGLLAAALVVRPTPPSLHLAPIHLPARSKGPGLQSQRCHKQQQICSQAQHSHPVQPSSAQHSAVTAQHSTVIAQSSIATKQHNAPQAQHNANTAQALHLWSTCKVESSPAAHV